MKYLFSLIVTLAPSAIWAVAPEQLPEPSTLALFGAAALAVGFVSMKKRRK
jgi:xanthosine utilization system XapX-like protein